MRHVTEAEAQHLNTKAYEHANMVGTLVARPKGWLHISWHELPTRGSNLGKLNVLMERRTGTRVSLSPYNSELIKGEQKAGAR